MVKTNQINGKIGPSQKRLLAYLALNSEKRNGELAKALQESRGNITNRLKSLHKAGLVKKENGVSYRWSLSLEGVRYCVRYRDIGVTLKDLLDVYKNQCELLDTIAEMYDVFERAGLKDTDAFLGGLIESACTAYEADIEMGDIHFMVIGKSVSHLSRLGKRKQYRIVRELSGLFDRTVLKETISKHRELQKILEGK